MAKPGLGALRANFQDHDRYPTMKDLHGWLGGEPAARIDARGFGPNGNTCAGRPSVAFDKGGAPISAAVAKVVRAGTLRAADGSHIIFRVAEAYLLHTPGRPAADDMTPFDSDFRTKRGIIAFSVNWRNATGHIALFNRGAYREAHDDYAAFVNGPSHTSRGLFRGAAMMRAILTIAAMTLATSTAAARTPLQRDVEGFASAACLAQQSPAYLKQQGEGWAQIIVARGHGSPRPLDALDRVVRAEAMRAPPYVNRDETDPMKGSPMPIAFCAELVDRPVVRAAIARTMAALAPAYRGR